MTNLQIIQKRVDSYLCRVIKSRVLESSLEASEYQSVALGKDKYKLLYPTSDLITKKIEYSGMVTSRELSGLPDYLGQGRVQLHVSLKSSFFKKVPDLCIRR